MNRETNVKSDQYRILSNVEDGIRQDEDRSRVDGLGPLVLVDCQ